MSPRFKRPFTKILLLFAILLLLVGAFLGWAVFAPNALKIEKETFLYIPNGAVYSDVIDSLETHQYLKHPRNFQEIARSMKYPEHVYAGRYRMKPEMSNFDLIRLLRSGKQSPVKVIFNKERTKKDVAAFLSSQLEPDSAAFMDVLDNIPFLDSLGFSDAEALCAIIPNTYQFFWNTEAKDTYLRFVKERNKFWNAKRKAQADSLKLTQNEVYILASIVEEETNNLSEKPLIASVYLNRIRIGMKLGADPTVKFAWKNFALKRVRGKHLKLESPYNTYLYKGLPPGPICTPSIKTIDAVLEAPQTDYYYFTAKADLSGEHLFEENYVEHRKNARAYHKALNKLNIK